MEPLVILRDCIVRGKVVREDGEYLDLGGRRIAKSTPTAFMVQMAKGRYYPIGSLYLQYKHKNEGFKHLRRVSQEQRLVPVRPTDKKDVLEYLTGAGDTRATGRIDTSYKGGPATSGRSVVGASVAAGSVAASALTTATEAAAGSGDTIAKAKRAFSRDLQKLQAKCGCAAAPSDVSKEEEVGEGMAGPLDAYLPRPAKRRRLPGSDSHKSCQEFLDHDVPFTQEIMKRELGAASLHTLMNARSTNFLGMFDMLKRQRKAVKEAHARAMAERRSAVTGTPIIIVPAAPSSIINMFNVKRFLEDGVHVDTATAKAASNGTKPSKVQVIGKTKDGKKLKFNVIDNVALLGDERQWSKVVAVFVHGPAWQFKNWLWKSPVDIFTQVLGFHLRYDSDQPHKNAAKWRVQHLVIGKSRRTQDIVAAGEFWRFTMEYVRVKKPHLMAAPGSGSSK